MQDFSEAKTELWTLYLEAVQVRGQSQPTATKRIQKFTLLYCKHGRRKRGTGGPWPPSPPWIFMHGTNIVYRGLKMLFFDRFCYFPAFFAIFRPFFRCPP